MVQATQNGQPSQETIATSFLETVEAVNLDEVTIETVDVAINEWTDGKRVQRVAHIENYVPMKIFNRLLASRASVLQKRMAYVAAGGPESGEEDPMLTWMLSQVWAVWKLSEPSMTLEVLESGLIFEQVAKLFTCFFGHLLRQTPK